MFLVISFVFNQDECEVFVNQPVLKNSFTLLLQSLAPYDKESVFIGMKDNGDYHFAFIKQKISYCPNQSNCYDKTRKMQGGIFKKIN